MHLTPDQEAFVREELARGRLRSVEEATELAFDLWIKDEKNRLQFLAALEEAERDITTGNFTEYNDENLHELVEDIKREARAKLADVKAPIPAK
ncbi:hypothetical protein [Silvibacterium acidisoli]|uniref:hypothetical protein n=1 Tax=Acidobacteriaceae bacterium ZG23-2 TaxID=2883246 RepID=UPI00406CFFF5